jgi:hypothetical protein
LSFGIQPNHDANSYRFDLRIGQAFVATGIGMLF